ncbi:MAG: hypothetical protein Q9226_008070 [Calogaya cf. arnoldii]
MSAPYLALSHCWGTQAKFTVTSDNIERTKTHIPFDSLPKTFRDSIWLARQLEVAYLWIDSLCIIQDSTADWETESQKMRDVYANAYATISVSSAAGDEVGFLLPRPDATVGKILSYDEDTSMMDLRVRQVPRHFVSGKGDGEYLTGLAKGAKDVDFLSDARLSRTRIPNSSGEQVWTVTRTSTADETLREETGVAALIAGRITDKGLNDRTHRHGGNGQNFRWRHDLASIELKIGDDVPPWKDLIDIDGVKVKLEEAIVYPIKEPSIYKHIQGNGLLLFGSPGCGKTVLIQSLIREAGCSLLNVTAGVLFSKWQGETEKAVDVLFFKARVTAPCVIFIDEIYAMVRERNDTDSNSVAATKAGFLQNWSGLKG